MKNGNKEILNATLSAPKFPQNTIPNGVLQDDRPHQALWYYYICARRTYDEVIRDPLVYEGEKDPETNLRQLFTSVATWYGTSPEAMAKCWQAVDAECAIKGYPQLPDEERYRHYGYGKLIVN